MYSSSSTILETPTSRLSAGYYGQEKVRTNMEDMARTTSNSSFATAQRLFRQQSSPLESSHPINISRHRTYTAPSLYTRFEQSIEKNPKPENGPRSASTLEELSFADSFMKSQGRPAYQSQQWIPPLQRPQTPVDPACILPGPKRTNQPFNITNVRASTTSGAPAWWCRYDKLVIFDGVRPEEEGKPTQIITRTSKGLEVSRKRCPKEKIHVDLNCQHCREMLGKKCWVYEVRVLERSVCHNCQERCMKELEKRLWAEGKVRTEKADVLNRRDSVLAQIEPEELQVFASKELRKIQSDTHLRYRIGEAELKSLMTLRRDSVHADTFTPPTKEVRRVQSEHRLKKDTVKAKEQLGTQNSPLTDTKEQKIGGS